jgi:hypothetical protein
MASSEVLREPAEVDRNWLSEKSRAKLYTVETWILEQLLLHKGVAFFEVA